MSLGKASSLQNLNGESNLSLHSQDVPSPPQMQLRQAQLLASPAAASSPFESAKAYPRAAPVSVSDQEDEDDDFATRQLRPRKLSSASSQPSFDEEDPAENPRNSRTHTVMDSAYELSSSRKGQTSASADSHNAKSEQPKDSYHVPDGRQESWFEPGDLSDTKENMCGGNSLQQKRERSPLSPTSNHLQLPHADSRPREGKNKWVSEMDQAGQASQTCIQSREQEAARWLAQKFANKAVTR
jgi:hypothetical protein